MMLKPDFRWGWILLWCASFAHAAEEARPAAYTTKQVLEGLDGLHRGIRAWSIEYQAVGSGLRFYVHKMIAARFPDSCLYRGAKGPADFDGRSDDVDSRWKDHPFQDWILLTSTHNLWGKPFNREFGEFPLARDAPLPDKIRGEVLFVALGWWPFEKRPSPELIGGDPCVIPDIVRSSKYLVRPAQQLRDGRWCHVLENPGRDRLWIDCERNFAIVAREVYDSATGATAARLDSSGHREAKPGIWIPREIRNVQFDFNAPSPEQRQKRIIDSRVRLLDVRLNDDVDERLFQPQSKPAGALEVLEDGKTRQIVPGGHEHMDNLAEWLRQATPPTRPATIPWAAARDYGVMALALTVIIILGCRAPVGRRRGRNRSAEGGVPLAAES